MHSVLPLKLGVTHTHLDQRLYLTKNSEPREGKTLQEKMQKHLEKL
jgi:hypothetical protein